MLDGGLGLDHSVRWRSWALKCRVLHSVLILTTIDRATTTEDVRVVCIMLCWSIKTVISACHSLYFINKTE